MPQEIRVLCCFKCNMYQTDIVKKSKKWQCKICYEKQSVFKVLFRGTGAECRQKAKKLNYATRAKQTEAQNEFLNLLERDDLDIDFEVIAKEELEQCNRHPANADSKWTQFVEVPNEQHFEGVKINDLKRNASSTTNTFDSAKCHMPLSSSHSKWDAYL